MLERTFTYEGFDGKIYTDTWGFYLSKADLIEINYGSWVGIDNLLKQLVQNKNGKEIVNIVKEVVLKSVGRPSVDGRRFIRNDETRQEFYETDGYSQLMSELLTEPNKVIDFLTAVIPKEMGEKLRQSIEEGEAEHQMQEVQNMAGIPAQ